jgi:Putative beta-barrel porin-2, OmpL-like. bbp2/Carboxypeptidase regulatory-like domain
VTVPPSRALAAYEGSTFGEIHGTTRDSSAAPLPKVQVRLHSVEDDTYLTVFSGSDGMYLAQNLRPGTYQVIASKDGFVTPAATGIHLAAGDSFRDDITLETASNSGAPAALTSAAGNSDAPLADRERQLLYRIDRLEQRLAAMEAKQTQSSTQRPGASPTLLASLSMPAILPTAKSDPLSVLTSEGTGPGKEMTRGAVAIPAAGAEAPITQRQRVPKPAPSEPFAYADWTWLNGNARTTESPLSTKYFTGEFRADANYTLDQNHPRDDSLGGSTETFRSDEVQVEQLSFGGDLRVGNVRGRVLTMFGMFATTTPRNDPSTVVGQWDLRDAYRYVSEAWGGYHFNVNHGLNLDAGIFVSYIGLFSYYNFDNWAYQPSYVSSNTPWFFNGVRVQWFPSDKLKIEPWFINGWQSYARSNRTPGLGGQILYRPKPWLSMVFNNYGMGEDAPFNPGRSRIHTDDSVEVKYFDHKKNRGLDKMAFSLTGDLGCEYGGGVSCTGDHKGGPKQAFLGWMAYNRWWFDRDRYAITLGGGVMSNPGRYLTLLPPINGADAISGTPYFTENPGDKMHAWDTTLTLDWMPSQFITFRFENGYRFSSVPYWSGRGGITPPGGNNGFPQYYACSGGASSGTNVLAAAEAACGGDLSSVWFPDLRQGQYVTTVALMVKF